MIGVLAPILMIGCASTPRQEMPDSIYTAYGRAWLIFDLCAKSGNIPPDTAAQGQLMLQEQMHRYQFSPDTFNKRLVWLSTMHPSASNEACIQAAMDVARHKQQIENNRQANAFNQQANSRPVQTTCNRVGTQTFCNSF